MKEFIRMVACSICQLLSPDEKPDITFYEIDNQAVQNELKELDIKVPLGLFDAQYYYTTLWGIKEIVKYCREVYPFPKYKSELTDCDDFSMLLSALVSAEFGINDFGIALGWTPMGYHAYNIARVEQNWINVEPQTGEIFELGDKGYSCDRVIL